MLSCTSLTSKACIQCGEVKPLGEYHAHSGMRDGHLNKCKVCVRAYVKQYQAERAEYYREYKARKYQTDPNVRQRHRRYEKTEAGKASVIASRRRWMAANAEKRTAHNLLNSAIRSGKVEKPAVCSMCGTGGRIHGHHPDYSQPLSVIWCCALCHTQLHKDQTA